MKLRENHHQLKNEFSIINSSIILYSIAHTSMELREFNQALEYSKRALVLDGCDSGGAYS
jgi:hypothetical protein